MTYVYVFMLSGLALATIFGIKGVENSHWYLLTVATLLAAGLYSSTYGISLRDAREHVKLIVKAITIGVFLKALIIGSVMTLVMKSPIGFMLGIIVAQIDPLSTTALMKGNRMSVRAQAILRAWSSFDDPMTVIMSLYVPAAIALFTGVQLHQAQDGLQSFGLAGYLLETGVNLLFAGGIYTLWRLIKRHSKATNYFVVALVGLGMYGLFIGALSIAVYYFWMLGIAVLGLVMRPPIDKAVTRAVSWALSIAAVLLGILLAGGVRIWLGVALGLAAYVAQIMVGLLLTGKLPMRDRLHIAFAQQNGITAIILALLFEPRYPGMVAVVAPAIVAINTIHALANHALDMYLARDFVSLHPRHHLERLRTHVHKI